MDTLKHAKDKKDMGHLDVRKGIRSPDIEQQERYSRFFCTCDLSLVFISCWVALLLIFWLDRRCRKKKEINKRSIG